MRQLLLFDFPNIIMFGDCLSEYAKVHTGIIKSFDSAWLSELLSCKISVFSDDRLYCVLYVVFIINVCGIVVNFTYYVCILLVIAKIMDLAMYIMILLASLRCNLLVTI